MPVPALVDLVVGRAQADGAVVVAFFGRARRHCLCCVDGVNSSFLSALCLPLCDPLTPDFAPASTRPAFFMTDADVCLSRRAKSLTVIGQQSEALLCLLVSYGR